MYVVHKNVILDNVDSIRNAFAQNGLDLDLHYSYKTNAMPEVIDIIDSLDVCPEVVSEYEFRKVPSNNKNVICNGVAMSYEEIAFNMMHYDNFCINFNDVISFINVRQIIGGNRTYEVGLRVRFDNTSRFGIHVDDLSDALKLLDKNGFVLKSLHCHVTATRELSKYREKVRNIVKAVKDNDLKVSINLGGSMYGKMSKSLASQFDGVGTFDDYASIIADEIKVLDYKPLIILELGTALIANAVSIVGEIVRIDEYNRVVLDIDKFTIGMPLNKKIDYVYLDKDAIRSDTSYCVYGCSCIEDDILIDDFSFVPILGEKIEFFNCGAYSYCFEPDFIIPKGEVKVV